MALISWIKSFSVAKTPKNAKRNYDAAKYAGPVWGGPLSYASPNVNVDLAQSREIMRQRARNAYQNNASARAIVESLVGLIVSTGIDVVPDSGNENDDRALREQWVALVDCIDASGCCDLWELQRQAMRGFPTAGEFLWQIVHLDDPSRPVPFAIMALEPDQLSETPIVDIAEGNSFCSGIETDRYGRPQFYHILSAPGDSFNAPLGGSLAAMTGGAKFGGPSYGPKITGARIPADSVIHGFEKLRPGQVRGEVGLAPVLGTLHQERQLVETELTSAKIGAAPAMAITRKGTGWPGAEDPAYTGTGPQGSPQYDFTPGSVAMLGENESIEILKNDRPSQMIAPFRAMLRGDLAGAMRIPQRYIDRDVSRANYSSMRADMLDTRRLLDPVQTLFGRSAAKRVYELAFVQLATAAGVRIPSDPAELRRKMKCAVHPDGWAYVDPEKDVRAASAAIAAGLSTWTDEAQRRGGDINQIWKQLAADTAKASKIGVKPDLGNGPPPAPAYMAKPAAKPEESTAPASPPPAAE